MQTISIRTLIQTASFYHEYNSSKLLYDFLPITAYSSSPVRPASTMPHAWVLDLEIGTQPRRLSECGL